MDYITTIEVAALALAPAIAVATEVLKRLPKVPVTKDNARNALPVITAIIMIGIYFSQGTLLVENIDMLLVNIAVYTGLAHAIYDYVGKRIFDRI